MGGQDAGPAAAGAKESRPKLLDQLQEALRARHYSRRTEEAYRHWVRRFIFFHRIRHPAKMGVAEINVFLTHLAVKEKVAAISNAESLILGLQRFQKTAS